MRRCKLHAGEEFFDLVRVRESRNAGLPGVLGQQLRGQLRVGRAASCFE
jgi:hypothetical protein